MEKRAILAIALSILVLFSFKYFEERRTAEARRRNPAPIQTAAPRTPPPPAAPTQEAAATAPALAEAPTPAAGDTAAAPRTVVIESPLYRAVLDARGGVLTSWTLKQYMSASGVPFEMISTGGAG